MTILRPANNRNRFILFVVLSVFFAVTAFNIYKYNRFVGLRHSVRLLEKEIGEARLVNADLKSQTYQLVDAVRLEQLARERGMILERKPEYLSVGM